MPSNLPAVVNAKFPVAYQDAKQALARCVSLDEAKEWADKAAAIAGWAKMAGDESLVKDAVRFRAHAIRRCGELLKEVEPQNRGDHRSKGRSRPVDRTTAGDSAGLSPRQVKTALRIANVPEADFEEAVESDDPPTITELAERGTSSKPKPLVDLKGRSPADFRASTEAQAELERMAKMVATIPPERVVAGALDHERSQIFANAKAIGDWIIVLVHRIAKERR